MRHAIRDCYHIFDWPKPASQRGGFNVTELWDRFPDLVVGKYLVNTSFDSGFLTLSEEEKKDGWRMVGTLAHSPKIKDLAQIPHDQFDEWMVFDNPVEICEFETMVNFGGFSPIDFSWTEKLDRYWSQLLALRPLHVIAENDSGYLVTRDADLSDRIIASKFEPIC
jgi:hypothetical protein